MQVGELFHRLVRSPVFAQSNAVMREHIDNLLLHDGRQPNGRTHVVGEEQERRSLRNDAAIHGHAVQNRAHPVLANTEVQIAPGVTPAPGRTTKPPRQHQLLRYIPVAGHGGRLTLSPPPFPSTLPLRSTPPKSDSKRIAPASAQFNAALSEVLGHGLPGFALASCRPSTPDQSYRMIRSHSAMSERSKSNFPNLTGLSR